MRTLVLALLVTLCTLPASDARPRKKRESFLDQIGNRVEAALVKPPVDQEVCFSPDDPCDTKLVKFVDSALASLDVAIFDVTLDEFAHHLLVASRKFPVRVLVDKRQAKGAHSLVRTLVKGGAQVRFGRQRGIMHNKFTIIDAKMVETGSFNYTNNATRNNNENQLYSANPAVVAAYRKRFEKIWSEGTPVGFAYLN
jgi:phosphatidylserine/phosphatidylglycerophosphate/cardiolipin synthase-like enzyme